VAKNTPAFQFYPRDFMGGVCFLSDEACGIYIKVMCVLWEHGNSLAKVIFTDTEVMHRVWPEIEDKFVIENGKVTHHRFTKMIELSEIRRQSGGKGGKATQAKVKQSPSKSKAKAKAKPKELVEERSTKNEERKMKNESEDWVFPDGWDSKELRDALDGWCEMRKRIKKPVISKKSTSKIFRKFDSASHLIEVAEICEANGWQGLKPEYSNQRNDNGNRNSRGQTPGAREFASETF